MLPCKILSGYSVKAFSGTGIRVLNANICTTSGLLAHPKWNISRKLPQNPNSYGPLTDAPDYSFLDGRPVPPGSRALNRMKRQQELAQKAVQLMSEMDFAVQRNERIQLEKQEQRTLKLKSKLKPKGDALLKAQ